MYNAKVLPILIASPSDVFDERKAATEIVYEFNFTDSFQNNLVLLPVGWDTHASPELGQAPQDQINERLVDRCDVVVGVFWTRVGTPTANEISGSIEEIKRHYEAGKPVLLYFSEQPVAPESIDQKQYAALKQFKEWCQPLGLYQPFSNIGDFRQKLARHLRLTLNDNSYLKEQIGRFSQIESEQEAGLTTVSFSEMAVNFLRGAADGNGMLSVRDYLGGTTISAGENSLETTGSGKEDAEARAAVKKLEEYGLIEERSYGSGIFFVTNEGFEALKQLP